MVCTLKCTFITIGCVSWVTLLHTHTLYSVQQYFTPQPIRGIIGNTVDPFNATVAIMLISVQCENCSINEPTKAYFHLALYCSVTLLFITVN